MTSVSLCAVILSIFALQSVNGLDLPYDISLYRQLLQYAPFYSFCELPWPTFFDPSYISKFNEIALAYDLRLDDVYQLHALIDNTMPNLPYTNEYNILSTAAYEMRLEMIRRGMYYLPSQPSCYRYNIPNAVTPTVPVPPAPAYRVKRSPDLITPAAYPTYPTNIPATDLSLAYKNLYVMLDQRMPLLPPSTTNTLRDSIIANTPLQYQPLIDDLLAQMSTNMRWNLGINQRMVPSFYY